MIIAEIEKGNATLLKTRRRTVTSKEAKFLSLLSVYSSTRLELALDQASLLPNQASHCKKKNRHAMQTCIYGCGYYYICNSNSAQVVASSELPPVHSIYRVS